MDVKPCRHCEIISSLSSCPNFHASFFKYSLCSATSIYPEPSASIFQNNRRRRSTRAEKDASGEGGA
jgi:hypothetical protein